MEQKQVELSLDSNVVQHDTLESKALIAAIWPDSVHKITTDKNSSFIKLDRNVFVSYAVSLIGTPYLYASTDPAIGFDCSGFITYVFNHFNISVPRSSVDFTHYGKEIERAKAKKGDLILFTGTNAEERVVGHMGIITTNTDSLRFIHSSSGKANGVTITALNEYYLKRFVKVIRVFE